MTNTARPCPGTGLNVGGRFVNYTTRPYSVTCPKCGDPVAVIETRQTTGRLSYKLAPHTYLMLTVGKGAS